MKHFSTVLFFGGTILFVLIQLAAGFGYWRKLLLTVKARERLILLLDLLACLIWALSGSLFFYQYW